MPTRQAGGFRKRPITHIGCVGDEAPLICPPETPCIAIIAALSAGEGGVILDTTGSSGAYFNVHYNFNDGEAEGDIGCEELSESYPLGEISQYFQETSPTIITLNVSQNECDTVACSTSFTINPEAVEIELEGDDFIFTPTIPECDGEIAFVAMFEDGITDVVLDAETGQVTIPAQETEGGIFVCYMTCNGNVVAAFPLSITNPALGLRMVFDDIANAPVIDPANVGQWNTFFDLPNNGLVFTSVLVTGSQVTLFGGGSMIIEDSLFASNTNLIEIEDHAGVVIEGGTYSFIECTNLTRLVFPEMLVAGELCFGSLSSVSFYDLSKLTIAGSLCFENWTIQSLALYSLITAGDRCFGTSTCTQYLMPVATTIGEQAFSGCLSAAYIEIPLCVNLGTTPTDATVFTAIVGQTISLYIAAVNATNNAGAEHASIAALLIANPLSTVNYI